MTVLILFATVEGQTGKIAKFAEAELRKAGQETRRIDVADDMVSVPFEGVDKVILAGSVHERMHPRAFEVFLASERKALQARKTLLLSVSLSAAFEDGIEEAGEYVAELASRTGFTPVDTLLVAGALRIGEYDYFATQVVRHVVMRGRDFDAADGSHEFTDWDALAGRLAAFAAM